MNSRFLRHLQITLAALDVTVLYVVTVACKEFFNKYVSLMGISYSDFSFHICLTWLLISLVNKLYNEKYIIYFEKYLRKTTQVYICFLILLLSYRLFTYSLNIPPAIPAAFFVITSLSVFANRIMYLMFLRYLKRRHYAVSKLLIIGYNAVSKRFVDLLEDEPFNKEIVGFCEDAENVNELSNYPVLTNFEGILDVCQQYGVNEIYSTIAPEQRPELYDIISEAEQNCIRFKIIPDTGLIINRKVHFDYLHQQPVITLRKEPLEELSNRVIKRGFDFMFSLFVVLFVLSWLIPIIALAIKLESRGPVFFVQPRSGRNNKVFLCFKFRSMKVNELAHSLQASKNDSRITKVGRFLRKTNLDEFPQFLNVLLGNMSIVGPRPHMLKHTDQYSKLIGHFMVRQFIKPGITGWAQVNGYRGETKDIDAMKKRVEYDLWYMENWSVWLDLKVTYLTVVNTLQGEKNAF